MSEPKALEWECVDDDTMRAWIAPLGWLVRYSEPVCHLDAELVDRYGYDWRPALAFVPDPEQKWIIAQVPRG